MCSNHIKRHYTKENLMSEKIVEIKTFSPEIYQFVCQLTQQLAPNHEVPSEKAFRTMLDSENAHLFVIHDDNKIPAGMLSVGIYQTPTGCKAWIEDVVVDHAYRGHGYGKMMVEHAIGFIRNAGAGKVSLTSGPARIAANHLYQTLGFEKYETNVYKYIIHQRG